MLIGAVIVVICYLLVLGDPRSAQVKHLSGYIVDTAIVTYCKHAYIECGISCHSKCSHLVPDFCGMSMEMANQMLQEMRAANKRKTPLASTNKANASWDRPTSTGSTNSQNDVSNLISKLYIDDNQAPTGPTATLPYRPETSQQHMKPMPPPPSSPDPYARPQQVFDPRMNMPQPMPPPHGTPNRYAPVPNNALMNRPPAPPQVSSPKMPQQGYNPQPYPIAPTQPGYQAQRPQPPQHEMSRVSTTAMLIVVIILRGSFILIMKQNSYHHRRHHLLAKHAVKSPWMISSFWLCWVKETLAR